MALNPTRRSCGTGAARVELRPAVPGTCRPGTHGWCEAVTVGYASLPPLIAAVKVHRAETLGAAAL